MLNERQIQIADLMLDRANQKQDPTLISESLKLSTCYTKNHCHSRWCIHCMQRRASRQRKYLCGVKENGYFGSLKSTLEQDPSHQLWFITACVEDSPEINQHALAAVRGMKTLLRDPRLATQIVGSFSVLEISRKHGRKYPCCHVHTLLVTKPLLGRYYVSQPRWVQMWEQACPLHRKRITEKLLRKNDSKPIPKNISILAKLVPKSEDDFKRVGIYVSKWASEKAIADNYYSIMHDPTNPNAFAERIEGLTGVTRFWGSMAIPKRSKKVALPATPHLAILAPTTGHILATASLS